MYILWCIVLHNLNTITLLTKSLRLKLNIKTKMVFYLLQIDNRIAWDGFWDDDDDNNNDNKK